MKKTNVVKKTYTFTYGEIRRFYDSLNKFVLAEGTSGEISYAAIKNLLMLDPVYKEVMEGLYIPENDHRVIEYKNAVRSLEMKYSDIDSEGNIKLSSENRPIVTKNIGAFKKELEELDQKNMSVITAANNASKNNNEYLSTQKKDLEIFTLESVESVPDSVPPIIMFYLFKDEFDSTLLP